MKSILMPTLKFIFAVGLILFLVQRGHLDFFQLSFLLRPQWFLLFMTMGFVNILLMNHRWQLLLQSQGFRVGLKDTLPIQFIGLFFNFAIPGAVGGDFLKAYYLAQSQPARKMAAVTSVIVDRILGLYAMVAMALLSFYIMGQGLSQPADMHWIGKALLVIFLVMTSALALSFSSRVQQWSLWRHLASRPWGSVFERAYQAFYGYKGQRGALATSLALSLISQATSVLFLILVGEALGENMPFQVYLVAAPLGFILSAIPLSPGGIGVGQVAFSVLFQTFSGTQTSIG